MIDPITIYPAKYYPIYKCYQTIGGWAINYLSDRYTSRPVDGGKIYKSRQNAYKRAKQLNETLQKSQEQKENALLIALCREAGDTGTDAELIDGARGNHQPALIRDAANGDVAALVQLRRDFGLPILA